MICLSFTQPPWSTRCRAEGVVTDKRCILVWEELWEHCYLNFRELSVQIKKNYTFKFCKALFVPYRRYINTGFPYQEAIMPFVQLVKVKLSLP